MLGGYWAGVPSRDEQQWWIPRVLRNGLIRYASIEVPNEVARWLPLAVALRRLGRLLPHRLSERCLDFAACRLFDKQVASALEANGATTVIACEISALNTFRAAKRLGIKTILDAPSFHHALQDRVCQPDVAQWLHKRILQVKDAEIRLADHILTVSELARASYIEAGVADERVHAIALGADTQLFRPLDGVPTKSPDSEPCVFVFAGATIYRKGVDVLLDAFRRVEERLPGRASLTLIGPRGDAAKVVNLQNCSGVQVMPPVSQSQLRQVFCSADCFVLPSRHDSFGMVVAEAMACGLPAIVSGMVGAKDIIDVGENGWVLPVGDVAALTERIAWCVQNREALAAMRPKARAAAERHGWGAYRKRLSNLITNLASDVR